MIAAAEKALLDERRLLTADELSALASLPDGAVMNLAALAHQVRLAWCGPEVEIEGILSAKTGGSLTPQSYSILHCGNTSILPLHIRLKFLSLFLFLHYYRVSRLSIL